MTRDRGGNEKDVEVKRKRSKHRKKPARKHVRSEVWRGDGWRIVSGRLVPPAGHPSKTSPLFEHVGEMLPYGCLSDVHDHMRKHADYREGVYLAHDSMGFARYGGRGQIFARLRSHKRKYPRELAYFSFYVVREKRHEREVETLILRAAGPQMILNTRKVRSNIERGSIFDYEAGTCFIERQKMKGARRSKRSKAVEMRGGR